MSLAAVAAAAVIAIGNTGPATQPHYVHHHKPPPHHQLWLCIHSGEASWHDTGDPYWGGLQMHPGWGYGTSYHASDDTPLEQEWAAERGYRASGYSRAWLFQQWGADAHCFY